MRTPLVATLLLAACAHDPLLDDTDDTNPFGEATGLACPDLTTGEVTLEVDGRSRTLQVELPADPHGAPVVFAWHWLRGNATQILDWMGMRTLADDGLIVIAPETSGLPFEWDFVDSTDANPDLALFDATLACLWAQHRIDADRVYATGMSAGGLMTTFLTMHRAESLAATAPFSGGAFPRDYAQPDQPLPVMITWGGPSDTYGGYDFHGASTAFADLLEDDGHLAVRCMHSLGHLPPAESAAMSARFFSAHHRGAPSPWRDALPADLPAFCE